MDRIIDQYRKIYAKEERIPLLRKVDEIIASEYPYIFFFNGKYSLYAHTKRIQKPKDTFRYGIGQQFWTIK